MTRPTKEDEVRGTFLPFIPVKFGVDLYNFTGGLIYIGSILFNGWSTANDR